MMPDNESKVDPGFERHSSNEKSKIVHFACSPAGMVQSDFSASRGLGCRKNKAGTLGLFSAKEQTRMKLVNQRKIVPEADKDQRQSG
jgi:hypothetical protein